ncbi:MAG: PKD domain-containing protein [Cyclobacteriaceae bacterium]
MAIKHSYVLSFFLLLFGQGAFYPSLGQEGFPYCESFQGDLERQATVLGGAARLIDGVVRLTDAREQQNGFVFIDIPFPSSFGVKISFEYFSYGGTGADGLSMFLFDAATPAFSPGSFGGSLGYAPSSGSQGRQGLTGAYLGIGFDSFGNFGNQENGKEGSFPNGANQLHPNSLVVRGPGQGNRGYEFVVGIKTNEGGPLGLPQEQRFSISSGGQGTNRVTDPNLPGYRKVFIDLMPGGPDGGYLLTLEMMVGRQNQGPMTVTLMEGVPYPYDAPEQLKMGFTASTGSLTNIHEIRNLLVEVSDEDGLSVPEGTDLNDLNICLGQENFLEIPMEEILLTNENSEISCLKFYAFRSEINEDAEDPCLTGNCDEEATTLEIQEGTFKYLGENGAFSFTPQAGFNGEEIEVYYTITDSYGKTSLGNQMVLQVYEAANPITLMINDLPMAEYNACPEEEMVLSIYSEDPIVHYEWYKDDNLLEGQAGPELMVNQEGIYYAKVLSDIGCRLTSTTLAITQIPFPDLEIFSPIQVCHPDQFPNIRDYITDYNDLLYNYQVTDGKGNEFTGAGIDSIRSGGQYFLQVKPKEIECWSEPLAFDIMVPDIPLEALFDYVLNDTGLKEESEDGILSSDRIRFLDKSSGSPRSWEWDFGDGETSRQSSPSHVYDQKGNFIVTLWVKTSEECVASYQMEISITRTYRVMFPTGFTPTREGDTHFRPKVKGIASMDLKIFNGWGELLFQTTDLNSDGWDGTLNGQPIPPGTYVYRADFETNHNEEVIRSGKFLLIR